MSQMPFAWGRLHYEERGSGAPVMLISGLNGLGLTWQKVLAGLARDFRIITHDHRGLGQSSPWDGPYSVEQIASDVLGLMDGLGIDRAHIIGHSLGGAVAQFIAAHHPQRVDHLVILASWAGPEPYFSQVMNMRKAILTGLGIEVFLRTGPIGIYPPDWITRHHASADTRLADSLRDFPGTEVMLRRMEACLAHDQRHNLQKISAPTLVIGVHDDMSTPAHCSAEIANAIHDAHLIVLPYGGHNAQLVVPDQVQRCITNFIPSAR